MKKICGVCGEKVSTCIICDGRFEKDYVVECAFKEGFEKIHAHALCIENAERHREWLLEHNPSRKENTIREVK